MHKRQRHEPAAGPGPGQGARGDMGCEVAGYGAGRDGVEQGGAHRPAELLPGIDAGRGHARVGGGDAERSGVDRGRDRLPEPGADEEQRRQHIGRVAGVDPDPGQPDQAARGEQHSGRDQRLGPESGHQDDVRQVGRRHDAPDHRQERDARDDRGEAQGELQVVGEEQEDAEDSAARDEDRQVGRAAVAVQHDPQRQQRRGSPGLPPGEHGQQRDSRGQESPGGRGVPVVSRGVGEPVDDAEHPARHGHHARNVQPGPFG